MIGKPVCDGCEYAIDGSCQKLHHWNSKRKGDPMTKIARVHVEPDHQLRVEFSDGLTETVYLSSRLVGPIFEPLKDPAIFAQAHIDEFGAITWPNGADLAPDALHATLRSKNPRQPSKVRTP